MLEHSLFESTRHNKSRKPFTVFVATIIHGIAGIILVLIPLFQIQAVTIPMSDMSLWAPQPERPRAVEVTTVRPPVRSQVDTDPNDLIAPPSIPSDIVKVVDPLESPSVDLPLPFAREGARSIVSDLINRQARLEPPSPPPPPASSPPPVSHEEPAKPIRVSAGAQQAVLIHQVIPVYPPIAKITHIQGIVILEAVITKEGAVDSLRVIDGHPLLIQAARDAVRQWRYRPTLLNGEPVEVITTITVTFTLR